MTAGVQPQSQSPTTTTGEKSRRSLRGTLVRLPLRTATFPYRLYKRKISVQLILSHVVVVLLTILLLEAALVGFLLAIVQWGGPQHFLDYSVTRSAESTAALIASETTITSFDDVSSEQRERLRAGISLLTINSENSEPQFEIGVSTGGEAPNFNFIDHALITNRDGTVIVSSDAGWAPEGEPVSAARSPVVTQLTERAIELDGRPSGQDNLWLIEGEDRTTVVAYPILREGEMLGVVTLHSERAFIPSVGQMIRGIVGANAVILGIMMIPALIVSIPIGIWRGRTLSKRLSALADTATTMSDGDLSQRVPVKGRDEVAQVSERFNDMVERLEETDRSRKSFVANVSHELRTPVAIIQGNVEHMLNGRSVDERQGETQSLEVIHQETMTLSRLIDDLFTLARIEEAQLPLVSVAVDVRELACQVVDGIAPVAWEQRKMSVQAVVPESLPRVTADPTRLRQILGNLIYNALRHTPEGGLVVVSAERQDDRVEIAVADTGVGMTEEQLARVFDRFYQVEREGRNAEGSGLGLSIVKQLVGALGSTIEVESQPGQGTIFRFTLPGVT